MITLCMYNFVCIYLLYTLRFDIDLVRIRKVKLLSLIISTSVTAMKRKKLVLLLTTS